VKEHTSPLSHKNKEKTDIRHFLILEFLVLGNFPSKRAYEHSAIKQGTGYRTTDGWRAHSGGQHLIL